MKQTEKIKFEGEIISVKISNNKKSLMVKIKPFPEKKEVFKKGDCDIPIKGLPGLYYKITQYSRGEIGYEFCHINSNKPNYPIATIFLDPKNKNKTVKVLYGTRDIIAMADFVDHYTVKREEPFDSVILTDKELLRIGRFLWVKYQKPKKNKGF